MKTARQTDSQIEAILKQAEVGTPVPSLCCEHGRSSATLSKWVGRLTQRSVLKIAYLGRHRLAKLIARVYEVDPLRYAL
jgi:putative transposase